MVIATEVEDQEPVDRVVERLRESSKRILERLDRWPPDVVSAPLVVQQFVDQDPDLVFGRLAVELGEVPADQVKRVSAAIARAIQRGDKKVGDLAIAAIRAARPTNDGEALSWGDPKLGRDLLKILMEHCGEPSPIPNPNRDAHGEGAVDTLKRILLEREHYRDAMNRLEFEAKTNWDFYVNARTAAAATRARAEALWQLLDDIDTLADSTSRLGSGLYARLEVFQAKALELAKRRFEYFGSDGYRLTEPGRSARTFIRRELEHTDEVPEEARVERGSDGGLRASHEVESPAAGKKQR